MWLERRLDDLGVGDSPSEPGEHADVPALDQPETAGSSRDLRELPGQQVASLLAVELVRLGEEKRLARKVDAVPENVRRDTDIGGSGEEAVDLLASRRERHRAVENGDAARMQAIHLAGEREHGAAAERDDDRAWGQRPERPLADELERELPLEELQLVLGKRALHERERIDGAEKEDLPILAGQQQPRPRGPAFGVVGPLHLVEHEELARVRRHLHRRADHRRALVDPLLAGDEPDVLGSDPLSRAVGALPGRAS